MPSINNEKLFEIYNYVNLKEKKINSNCYTCWERISFSRELFFKKDYQNLLNFEDKISSLYVLKANTSNLKKAKTIIFLPLQF